MSLFQKHTPENQAPGQRRCAYCGNVAAIVWVHGHGQCSRCGINIEECCRGEQCVTSSD